MKKNNPISVTVGVFIPEPLHELMISAVCVVYEISREDLFTKKRTQSASHRKDMLYYLLKNELSYSDTEISTLVGCSRQNIVHSCEKMDWTIRNYLRVTCEMNNIKGIYSNLLKQQEEWLNLHLHKNSMMP